MSDKLIKMSLYDIDFLIDLVKDHRKSIVRGDTAYGTKEDQAVAIDTCNCIIDDLERGEPV